MSNIDTQSNVNSNLLGKKRKTVRCCYCRESHERKNCILVPSDGSNWNKWISVFGRTFEVECSQKVENYMGREHLGLIEKHRLKNCDKPCVSVILDHDYLKWKSYHVKEPSYYFELEPSHKRQKVEKEQKVPELKMDHDYLKLEDYRKIRDGYSCSTFFTNRNHLKNCEEVCVSVILDHDYLKLEDYNLKKPLIRKLENRSSKQKEDEMPILEDCREISEEEVPCSSSTSNPPKNYKELRANVILDHDYLKLKDYKLKISQHRAIFERGNKRKESYPQKQKPDEMTILKDHDYLTFEDFLRESGGAKDFEFDANKVLCSMSSILKITRVCYNCVEPAKYEIKTEKGIVTINMKCEKCGKRWKWCSTDN